MGSIEERRLVLQETLEDILGSDNVYFDPPENLRMQYPCLRYTRAKHMPTFADNMPYKGVTAYEIIYITREVRSTEMIEALMAIPYCTHSRHYVADNLHHDVFDVYV